MPFLDAAAAPWVALLALGPLAWAALTDLKRMEIPDEVHFALIGLFVVWAPLFLAPDEALVRVVQALVVLAVGLALAVFAGMGGGDMKLAAAAAPFIPPEWRTLALMLLCLGLVLLFAAMKALRYGWRKSGRSPHWVSLNPEEKQYPLGVAISAAVGILLAAQAA
ncbi:prepilin peptidase [Rhodovulum sp. DZ06]|uniref:prepilin peptidase n=1 Tax=Rhodovulum sp. DZ06 TaxID=3425126 RepID=UPI003D35766A